MSAFLIAMLCLAVVGTSFLSGIFGMAGGMILMGLLLVLLPVPEAMVLHGVTQMASNGWRGLLWWRHVHWRSVGAYAVGALLAVAAWALVRYVPSKPVAFLMLGMTPFLIWLAPKSLKPNPESPFQTAVLGLISMTLMLIAGVSGPLIDTFFLSGKLDRRDIVATKAMCQVLSHALKLVYFGGLIEQAASLDPMVAVLAIASALIGTKLAAAILESMTNTQYRAWSNRIIMTIACYYIAHGAYLAALPALAR